MIRTDRLLLRPWHEDEAAVLHELWSERDPRVPPHRRIDAAGRPTTTDLAAQIRDDAMADLPALERASDGEVVGYCGLVHSGRGGTGEPELAFEVLRRAQRRGYATEAATAVVERARSSGFERLWATVWDWNAASLRVLEKLGFGETTRREVDPARGTTLFLTKRL